jgi:hypothetical protein
MAYLRQKALKEVFTDWQDNKLKTFSDVFNYVNDDSDWEGFANDDDDQDGCEIVSDSEAEDGSDEPISSDDEAFAAPGASIAVAPSSGAASCAAPPEVKPDASIVPPEVKPDGSIVPCDVKPGGSIGASDLVPAICNSGHQAQLDHYDEMLKLATAAGDTRLARIVDESRNSVERRILTSPHCVFISFLNISAL